ncbi:hypothetical protein K8352_18735 [Flavobacteriaceae bacterium F89]|uniref:Uncharacterized protein n=1 Tax=Cerina litoralis TaxID=2874477 RepID=A0AAE3EX99_9FLAO|nr:DUF6730 family protein [Cerina litoralis]MCG2462807.1 hypothetical protein [Cerina litoralis]
MQKMDEIMELLSDEIDGFNKSIKKLEVLSKKWDGLQIKADSSNIEYHIKEHLRVTERSMERYNGQIREIQEEIKKAQFTPKWLMPLILTASTTALICLLYFGYHFVQLEDKKFEAFENGKKEAVLQLRGYFDKHPEAYKDYLKWSKRFDSIPSSKQK